MPACWSCGADDGGGPFCRSCEKIQPPRPTDPCTVLGVSPRYHLDEAELGRTWRELSRRLHPDKFVKQGARERRFALERTTQLNESHRALRDPQARAEAILRLVGLPVASDEAGRPGAGDRLPLEFYEQVMEDREALDEARAQGPDAVAAVVARATARRDATLQRIDAAFTAWERSSDVADLQPAAAELPKLRYEARFMDEAAGRPHD